ncbi:hypothetical protein PFISCL1PPCAC_18976 [Pristionchus fissidentatus]|uniref:Uncharacterized protein n=1 Tax=Pristionchus fissidentatus TaxID=1538716 RepID=A0AAV5W6T8_9BILA|nr:hypothetical protein PFISCL1PPCAC_18976 [Pristionchus fissidentatus]
MRSEDFVTHEKEVDTTPRFVAHKVRNKCLQIHRFFMHSLQEIKAEKQSFVFITNLNQSEVHRNVGTSIFTIDLHKFLIHDYFQELGFTIHRMRCQTKLIRFDIRENIEDFSTVVIRFNFHFLQYSLLFSIGEFLKSKDESIMDRRTRNYHFN